MTTLITLDNETDMIGPTQIVPDMVCVGGCIDDGPGGNTEFVGTHCEGTALTIWETTLDLILSDPDAILSNQSISGFDLPVVAKAYPHLLPKIFEALTRGQITCTKVREKLLNLSTHGRLSTAPNPDGSHSAIMYSLKDLALKHLGLDLSDDKDSEDSWRTNFGALHGVPLEDYPEEAENYVIGDCVHTLAVHKAQDESLGSLGTQYFQTKVEFALSLMGAMGVNTDLDEIKRVRALVSAELVPEKLQLLVDAKILRAPKAPSVSKAEISDLVMCLCAEHGIEFTRTASGKVSIPASLVDKLAKVSPVMNHYRNRKSPASWPALLEAGLIKENKSSINKKCLGALVEKVSKAHGFLIKETDSGQTSCDAEVIERLAPLDPVLAQYKHRQRQQKLVSTYLPVLERAHQEGAKDGVVYTRYNVLVETGRTSSSKSDHYPSMNSQQVDPRVRPCYVPRPGHLFLASDYSGIELVSFAHKCFKLFGHSVMRDQINAGADMHAFLGAQLALEKWPEFREMFSGDEDRQDVYEAFLSLKGCGDSELKKKFKHFRKLAKPVGLGYPGGLGAATLVDFARTTYGVKITEEEAKQFKELWVTSFPEAALYFGWVNNQCKDPDSAGKYTYTSPLGMIRAGCAYTAACNGAAMQTPVAEGAKEAVFRVVRACLDPTQKSVLLGCRPLFFIHDELVLEIPENDLMQARAAELQRIMVESMSAVLPDMLVKTEACFMRAWNKFAEPVFDSNGNLQVWEPKT